MMDPDADLAHAFRDQAADGNLPVVLVVDDEWVACFFEVEEHSILLGDDDRTRVWATLRIMDEMEGKHLAG